MKNAVGFLADLANNNNRDWFQAHKGRYQEALEEFRSFTEALLKGLVSFDPSLGNLQARDSIFRIYKDVRFSKDKSPYKTHFGCWMTKSGRKSSDAGYYFQLQPGQSFMGAGVYMPPSDRLKLIRQEILYQPQSWLDLIHAPGMEAYERGGQEDRLKKGPAGFPPDFPHMEEIKYKHYIYSRSYTNTEVLSETFVKRLVKDFQGLHPLVEYLNQAMSYAGNE